MVCVLKLRLWLPGSPFAREPAADGEQLAFEDPVPLLPVAACTEAGHLPCVTRKLFDVRGHCLGHQHS